MVKTALITLKKHYSGPYDSSLLGQLEPIFIKGLRVSRLRRCLINFWQQTFAHASHLHILDELRLVFIWDLLDKSNLFALVFNPCFLVSKEI